MLRTPRYEYIDCERIFDSNEIPEVDDGLLRLFLTVRLSTRTCCDNAICRRCRCQFIRWKENMEGSFDYFNRSNVESMSIDDSRVRN